MNKILMTICFLILAVGVWANPQTQGGVSHPTTQAVVSVPRTNVIVKKPETTASIKNPTTTVVVTHPTTLPTVSATAGNKGGSMGSGGNYASYKNAKTFAPTEAATPKAAKLGKGESGLGKDKNAAQKAAEAAASSAAKGESAMPSLDDVKKKTNMPANVMSLLKQRNFEAAGTAKNKK